MTHPPVVIVDENDQEIGSAMLAEAWKNGLYHRVVHIVAEDEQGRILLQRRAAGARLWPHRWDHSAGGHVDESFDYDSAAVAEVAEELGLHDVHLEKIATHPSKLMHDELVLNRFATLYRLRISADTPINPAQDEVSETRWFTLTEVKDLIKRHPEQFTDVFRYTIATYYS